MTSEGALGLESRAPPSCVFLKEMEITGPLCGVFPLNVDVLPANRVQRLPVSAKDLSNVSTFSFITLR